MADVWTGSEKQIEWAKRIRAEAEPVICEWIADLRKANAEDHWQRRLARRAHGGDYGVYLRAIGLLEIARGITDAKFWIDNRDCPSWQVLRWAVEQRYH